ncbi:hypothetical protein ACHQM5_015266 [Ranunculus cassubicifolius]
MNSSKPNKSSLNNYNFDFDLGSNFSSNNRSQPLKDQKQPSSTYSSSYGQQKPAWTPNKPSWTHQPAPSQTTVRSELLNPVSMVGDIHGKSWAAKTPANNNTSSTNSSGIVGKNPNLFSDLLGSALGGKNSGGNVPLKNAAPVGSVAGASKGSSSFSMGNVGDSLPKTGAGVKSGNNWSSGGNLGSYSSVDSTKTGNFGGPSMKNVGLGTGNAVKKDPFGSFVDFTSKKEHGIGSKVNATTATNGSKNSFNDNDFGDFQNAGTGKPNTASVPSNKKDGMGYNSVNNSKMNDFGNFDIPIQTQSMGVDPLDALFQPSSGKVQSDGPGNVPFSEMDDWDTDAGFGEGGPGSTTELEGLPPPPAGVTSGSAKNKGLDSYKQGQHADAIKWLSWAVVLLEKAGDSVTIKEVLSCRASCYKEVGEYKKAIADCTQVLESDEANVSVLLQRAALYESTEKYKLGAEDLRSVMKIDPGNRHARSTIHRLLQLAE